MKSIKIGKRRYKSLKTAANYYKKPYNTFMTRIGKLNWTFLAAAKTPVRKYMRRD